MATFAMRLRELRTSKNLSQLQLSEKIGITKQTVSLWERSKRRPNLEMMANLAGYFDVSLEYLLGTIDDPTPNNEENNIHCVANDDEIHELEELFDEISRMSEDTRKIVAAAVREAYRLDTMYGRLRDGYEVGVKFRRKVAED